MKRKILERLRRNSLSGKKQKKNNGELGFFSTQEYGEIGRIAASMDVGDMYGPVQVPEGYSLFELIDKRKKSDSAESNLNQITEKARMELKYKKFSDEIMKKTVELADKYGVSVNEELLNSVEVLNTTTVVYRYFGFGGRLLAVPMTIPNYLWVKPWMEKQTLTP